MSAFRREKRKFDVSPPPLTSQKIITTKKTKSTRLSAELYVIIVGYLQDDPLWTWATSVVFEQEWQRFLGEQEIVFESSAHLKRNQDLIAKFRKKAFTFYDLTMIMRSNQAFHTVLEHPALLAGPCLSALARHEEFYDFGEPTLYIGLKHFNTIKIECPINDVASIAAKLEAKKSQLEKDMKDVLKRVDACVHVGTRPPRHKEKLWTRDFNTPSTHTKLILGCWRKNGSISVIFVSAQTLYKLEERIQTLIDAPCTFLVWDGTSFANVVPSMFGGLNSKKTQFFMNAVAHAECDYKFTPELDMNRLVKEFTSFETIPRSNYSQEVKSKLYQMIEKNDPKLTMAVWWSIKRYQRNGCRFTNLSFFVDWINFYRTFHVPPVLSLPAALAPRVLAPAQASDDDDDAFIDHDKNESDD